ncbi:MAG: HlyD family efflux transporter periplasmic adaptor subunit [Pedosphaera sp.]|nr:HlyD family efflux transporter periplasmic adaptor subunit [Pedosphaera sp.]MSU43555.1 HlyD family efflux transporter periplasmic adaptor subunit [Pedosphaera sp.]
MARVKQFILRHPIWVFVVLGVLILSTSARWREPQAKALEGMTWEPVKNGPFRVTIVESGAVDSTRKIKISSELATPATLLFIVAEGEMVKKGDLLVQFADEAIMEKISNQRVSLDNSQREVTNAVKDLAIKREEVALADKQAEYDLLFAASDLKKYIEGDYPMQDLTLKSKKALAAEEMKRAEEKQRLTRNLQAKGYATETQVRAEEFTVHQKQLQVQQFDMELLVLQKYDLPKQKQRFEALLEHKRINEKSVKRNSEASLASYAAIVDRRQATMDEHQRVLIKYLEQKEKTTIRAPQDGLVIYSLNSSARVAVLLEKGVEVKPGQDLMELPDMSQMMVEIKIHESRVRQVRPGMQAVVRIESLPDRQFRAFVKKIAPLPDTNSRYYEPDLKVYNAEVWITKDADNLLPEDLKPGVSAHAEVLVAQLSSPRTVPIQCVVSRRGQSRCYVKRNGTASWIKVEVGLSNETTIEIKGGLHDGDEVALAPPVDQPEDAAADDARE